MTYPNFIPQEWTNDIPYLGIPGQTDTETPEQKKELADFFKNNRKKMFSYTVFLKIY